MPWVSRLAITGSLSAGKGSREFFHFWDRRCNLSGGSDFRKHPGSLCWQPIGRLTDVEAAISPAISIGAVIRVHGFFQSVRDIS
jgi:hypothetical protein